MPHALAAHFGYCDLDATFFTNDPTMLKALVLATQTFVVFGRTKNFGTKETITFGPKSTVINGFRFTYLTKRPRTNFFRRSYTDTNRIKLFFSGNLLKKVE